MQIKMEYFFLKFACNKIQHTLNENCNVIILFYRVLLRMGKSSRARATEAISRQGCLSQMSLSLQKVHGIRFPRTCVPRMYKIQEG